MSLGTLSWRTAACFCCASSARSRTNALSSSAASTRRPFPCACQHLGGIGAVEIGRPRAERPVGDREILREMVSLDAPAPCGLVAGRSEHREVVHLRVPAHVGIRTVASEHQLEIVHDLAGLLDALRAQRRGEQLLRGLALGFGHLLQRQPFALPRPRHIVPVEPVRVIELQVGLLAQLRRERREKLRGCGGGFRRRAALPHDGRTANQQSEAEYENHGFHGAESGLHGHILPARTSARWTARLSLFCAICSRQLNPSVTITVPGSAARTAGSSTRSPSVCETP